MPDLEPITPGPHPFVRSLDPENAFCVQLLRGLGGRAIPCSYAESNAWHQPVRSDVENALKPEVTGP